MGVPRTRIDTRPSRATDSSKEDVLMATAKQRSAARTNVKKAAASAKRKRTIAHLSRKTRTALGKKGAQAAKRKRRS
jgi:hypothetical protein